MPCFLFQAPNLESRELWKGFLYSVTEVIIHLLHTCYAVLLYIHVHFSLVLITNSVHS